MTERADGPLDPPASALPSGVISFVFFDLEGSTRLLHDLGDRYVDVLDRYRRMVADAIADGRGHLVSFEGDGAFAVFEEAGRAVEAAVAVQQALRQEEWPDGRLVRARVGLHTGLASPRDGDYVALSVHQAARVVGAAQGGQVLVSPATAALVDAPDLEPVGRFRLRDFDGPVELFQVVGPWTVTDRPPRAVPADRHNLVPPSSPTVGRDELIADVVRDVRPGTLTTLVGPGGVGKTRVAVEAGLLLSESVRDGVWQVGLASVAEDDRVPRAVAKALGLAEPSGDPMRGVLDHLARRQAVVLFDNSEHLAEATRAAADALLSECPHVAVLVTSRVPLRHPAEWVRRVDPLALPAPDSADATAVARSPAGELFLQRAGVAGFEVDGDTAPIVATLCRRVDGIPLLIELAAAQLAFRELDEILTGVDESILSLGHPGPSPDERHRTGEAVLDWSYRLLAADERRAFRRLSAFGAGFTPRLAEVAIEPPPGIAASELVLSLLDHSLLVEDPGASETRYGMLEPIRQFGRLKASETGDLVAAAVTLARHYVDRVGPWRPEDRAWVSAVSHERSNLRSVIPLVSEVEPELAQQLACVIGRHNNAVRAFERGVDEVSRFVGELTEPTATRASLLCTLADLRLRLGQTDQATEAIDEAMALAESVGLPIWDDVAVEVTLAEIAQRSGRHDEAMDLARRRLEAGGISDRGRARLFNRLGMAALGAGDLEACAAAFRSELEASAAAESDVYLSSAHGNLAEAAMRLGDVAEAAHHQSICLRLAQQQGDVAMVAFSLILAARIAASDQRWDQAVRLQTKADAMLDEIGLELHHSDVEAIDEMMGAAFGAVGRVAYRRLEQEAETAATGDLTAEAEQILDSAASA